MLKSLVEDAQVHLGEKVEEAVISVPAYFNDKQKRSTIEAAKLVGLKVERLINEPTAASLAYQIHDRKEENVLVIVDLGGGTFDVSVLDIFDDIIEVRAVRAVSGDNHFGGEDFDESLMRYFASKMERELDSFTKEQLAQIKYTAEQTKKKLSENSHVRVNLAIDGEQHTIEISEAKYEEIQTETNFDYDDKNTIEKDLDDVEELEAKDSFTIKGLIGLGVLFIGFRICFSKKREK